MKVVVGMSGGIDSSVVLLLLKEQGVTPVGVTLTMRPCPDCATCERDESAAAASAVARQQEVEHHIVDVSRDFESKVLRSCWDDIQKGRTPNPCIVCNAHIKFPALLAFADAIGAPCVATGHYARISEAGLRKGVDAQKDQSYFLCALAPSLYPRIRFPLGDTTKAHVRERARMAGLANAEQPESQDLCPAVSSSSKTHFAEELRVRFGDAAVPGDICDAEGNVLVRHQGYHVFTRGQYHGLGIATARGEAKTRFAGKRVRVTTVDPATARVTVSADPEALMSQGCKVGGFRWLLPGAPSQDELTCQTRYHGAHVPCTVSMTPDGGAAVRFATAQNMVTPGQYLAVYQGDTLVGMGAIESNI